MAAAAPIAIGLSMASTAVQGYGEYKAGQYEAAQSKAAAEAGRAAADQTETALSRELTETVASIQAIRSSAGVGFDSPTTQAILKGERTESARQRRIEGGNLRRQATQDDNDARFRRSAARMTLIGTGFKTAAIGAKGYAGMQ